MQTSDWALVISILSFIISLFGFIWSVWSKFVYPRASIRAYIQVSRIHGGVRDGKIIIELSAVNYGPTDLVIRNAIARKGKPWHRIFQKHEYALLNPYSDVEAETGSGPFSGGLPKKLPVGEDFCLYFPLVREWSTKENLDRYGFLDNFGRKHWCTADATRKFREKLEKSTDLKITDSS